MVHFIRKGVINAPAFQTQGALITPGIAKCGLKQIMPGNPEKKKARKNDEQYRNNSAREHR